MYTLDPAPGEDQAPNTGSDLQYEIAGGFLSSARAGAIILFSLGGACEFNQIGIWGNTGLTNLTKGHETEAAGAGVTSRNPVSP